MVKIIIVTALVVFAIRAFIRLAPWLATLSLLVKWYLASLQSDGDEPPPPAAQPVA
jgi:hypothetical protein